MGFWNRKSDWLPISNAEAQVDFYEKDLKASQEYLTKVMSYAKYNLPGYDKIYKIARKDLQDSERNIAKARITLSETQDRLKN